MKTSFKPFNGYIVVAIPEKEKSAVQLHESLVEKQREDYIKEGNELIVVAVGEGVEFAQLGDKVLIASHARLQKITVDKEPVYVIRASDILGKL